MATIAELISAPKISNQAMSGINQGIEAAKMVESLDMQKQQLEQNKQMLAQKQSDTLLDMIDKANSSPPKVARMIYKAIQERQKEWNIPVISDINAEMMMTDEDTKKWASSLLPQLKKLDPNITLEALSTMADQMPQKDKIKLFHDTIMKNADYEKQQSILAKQEEKGFTKFASDLSSDVRSAFKTIQADKAGIRSGYSAINDVIQMVQKGGQQKFSATMQIGPIAMGLAKAAGSGPLSDEERKVITEIGGLEGNIQGKVEKWLTGIPPMQKLNTLKLMLERGAEKYDTMSQELAKQIEPQFSLPQYASRAQELKKASGLDVYTAPTLPKKQGQTDMSSNIPSKSIPDEALQQLIMTAQSRGDNVYDVLSKKGFNVTQQQKAIIDKALSQRKQAGE